jgi:hypothetical protein
VAAEFPDDCTAALEAVKGALHPQQNPNRLKPLLGVDETSRLYSMPSIQSAESTQLCKMDVVFTCRKLRCLCVLLIHVFFIDIYAHTDIYTSVCANSTLGWGEIWIVVLGILVGEKQSCEILQS